MVDNLRQADKDNEAFAYKEMFDAGMLLPPRQRAMMAQHYYQRVHLRELGLRLAATCEKHILQQVFGQGADIIIEQASGDFDVVVDDNKRSKITLA